MRNGILLGKGGVDPNGIADIVKCLWLRDLIDDGLQKRVVAFIGNGQSEFRRNSFI